MADRFFDDSFREYVENCAYEGIEPLAREEFEARQSELAYARQCEAYYGGGTPQTENERREVANNGR